MFKILIIDDTEKRNDVYKSIFNSSRNMEHKLLIANELEDIEHIVKTEYYDIVLIDHNLDDGPKLDKVAPLIDKCGLPMIVISETRNFNYSDYDNRLYRDCIELDSLFNLFYKAKENESTYELEYSKAANSFCSRIISNIIKHHGSHGTGSKDKYFVICHLSDFHLRVEDTTAEFVNSIITAMIAFLNRRTPKPDLYAFSGDVGKTGYGSDYKSGIYNDIKKELLDNTHIPDRVIMVPGNHDIDISLSLPDIIKDSVKCKLHGGEEIEIIISDGSNSITKKITPDLFEEFKPNDNYKNEFVKFVYNFTGDNQYLIPNFYVENRCFRKKGFNVFGVSNAERYRTIESYFENDVKSYKKYQFDTDLSGKSVGQVGLPSICLGHASPYSLGLISKCRTNEKRCGEYKKLMCSDPRNQSKICHKSSSFINALQARNAIIYLYGHDHNSSTTISDDGKMLYIGSTAIDGTNPFNIGFNLISIETKNSVVTASIVHCEYINGMFDAEKPKIYEYCFDTNTWSMAK